MVHRRSVFHGQVGHTYFFYSVATDTAGNQQPTPSSTNISTKVVAPRPTTVPATFVINPAANGVSSGAISVLANDVSNDGRPQDLQAFLYSGSTHGALTLDPDGTFTYAPDSSFQGLDRFTYLATEGGSLGNQVNVSLISQTASVVDKLYNQVLGRGAEDAGLLFWTGQINAGASYSAVAEGIFESDERLNAIIGGGNLGSITYPGYYPQFLLRPVEPAGLAYWKSIWIRDGGPDHVISGMISSPEFYASAGNAHPDLSPNQAWVTELYKRLLNRDPTGDPGVQFWTGNLDSGALTQQQVVLGFVQSPENFGNLTTAFFQQYLNRNPSDAEKAQYVAQFKAGGSQRDVQKAIINTQEYANTPPPPAPGTVGKPLYLL